MKKIFIKFGILLILNSIILPLSACSFNFYINRINNSIANSFAEQTSSLIKSMIMSKELDVDTSSTNDDIMSQIGNNSINNLSKNTILNNWNDLQNYWGENKKINTIGFNANVFFKASGKGKLTKKINDKNKIHNIFSSLNYTRTISIISNPQLLNIILGVGLHPISFFLKSLQNELIKLPTKLQFISNLINDYDENFLKPLIRLFANLIDNSWSNHQFFTPINENELINFMNNWKDNDDQPYSIWNNNGKWKINPSFNKFLGHRIEDWKPEQDYDLYRSGVLINYLFWKISKDKNIFGKNNKNLRYLSNIISDYITINDIKTSNIKFDDNAFFIDIKKYFSYILTNPLYIFIIIEAFIPIIKKWILNMPDITKGIKTLKIGNCYSANKIKNSYNLMDIISNIKYLINNPKLLKNMFLTLFGKTTFKNRNFDTFLYDFKMNLKIKIGYLDIPVNLTLGGIIGDNIYDPTPLINNIINVLISNNFKNIINFIYDLIAQISKQYSGNKVINIDLTKLQNFLFNNTNGLLIIFKNDSIFVLKNIIKKNDIEIEDIKQLYKSLGGNIQQESQNFLTFTLGSVIDILQKNFLKPESELNNILNLLLGNTEEDHKLGIKDIIINDDNQWIKNNYEFYFDNNHKISNIYNIKMTKNIVNNNTEIINLRYDFNYKIKTTKYHFVIIAINIENLIKFQGIRDFKFKTIILI